MYRQFMAMIGGTLVSLVVFAALANGQTTTTDNPFPSRGFLPGTLVVESDAGDVSINSGNLNYRVPIFRFPGGPGSVPLDIGLVYNSFIYDPDGIAGNSGIGGGWQYSFQYQLVQDQLLGICPIPGAGFADGVRTSIVFPDGSRHVLRFNGPTSYNVGFDGAVFCPANNTPPLTGTLKFYTTDGTFVRVETSREAGVPYKIFLPDGTRLEGSGTEYPGRIVDRNGNFLTIVPYAYRSVPGGGFVFEPTFTITDQIGRRVDLTSTLDANNVPTDTVTFTAPGLTEPLIWTVVWRWYVASNPLFTTGGSCQPSTTCQLYPRILGVKEIRLPSVNGEQLKYAFQYYIQEDSDPSSLPGWGELRSVTTPYGAGLSYEYANLSSDLDRNFGTGTENVRVSKKAITWTDPQGVVRSQEWAFETVGSPLYPNSINVTGPDGGVTNYLFCGQQGTWGNPLRGKICVVTKPNQDISRTKWKYNCPLPGPSFGDLMPQDNLFAAAEFTSINGSQAWQTSIRSYDYDRNGNLLQLKEWDWQPGAISTVPAAPAARITNQHFYLTTNSFTRDPDLGQNCGGASNDSNAYWNSLPGGVLTSRSSTEIDDATQPYSRSEFLFDNPVTTANLISERKWRSRDDNGNSQPYSTSLGASNSITIERQYGYGGAMTQSTDANGVATTYDFNQCAFTGEDQTTHYAFPGQVTRAAATALARSTSQIWDCPMALLTDSTDANNVPTHIVHDKIGRLTQTTQAGARTVTSVYNEASVPVTMTTSRTLNTTGDNFQIRRIDQRGQIHQTQANDVYVDLLASLAVPADSRSYEATSTPHQASSSTTDGWTRTTFDQLNRPIQIDHFDGAALPYPWGAASAPTSSARIDYDGPMTTFTDEAGRVRRQTVDGLGRLIRVQEDPGGLNYLTTYQYDPLDNLTKVIRAGQQDRVFVYDSLSRLYSASNGESGTVLYRYDSNGNLVGKTDARNITTTLNIDPLNRVTSKTYSDATPSVTYCYDGSTAGNCGAAPTGANLVDRLTMVTSSASTAKFSGYSVFGEVLSSQQTTNDQSYTFAYTYNNLGQLSSVTYPSQRRITTTYDAAGRATGVTSPDHTYANSIIYAPSGGISLLALGNGKLEQHCYNARLQGTAVRIGSTATDANCSPRSDDLLHLAYTFNASENNGNLESQTITRPANVWTQSYGYDSVNRLSSAQETGAGTWAETYGYDSSGNRWVSSHTGTGMLGLTLETGTTPTWYSPAGNNRVNTWTYDDAGNVMHVGSMSRDFTYDAENRMTSATINGQTSTYTYDGDGRRVKVVTPSGTSIFVYDAMGHLAEEYGPATSSIETQYIATDALGSTRLTMNSAGQVVRNYDYLPFGEELSQGNGGPARDASFSGAGPRQKFTGKQRDAETGLDFFQVRYYSAAQGRFTSPDEYLGGMVATFSRAQAIDGSSPLPYADITDPQTLNKFGYVRNNPMRFIDPDGHDLWDAVDYLGGVIKGAVATISSGTIASATPKATDSAASLEGQAVGSVIVGVVEAGLGTSETILTAPASATGVGVLLPAVGVGVATHGVASASANFGRISEVANSHQMGRQAEPGSRPGKDFTAAGKREIDARAGGMCEDCGRHTETSPNKRGQPTPANQRQRHHVQPKSEGGSGTPENGKLLCPECHKKVHKQVEPPY